MVGKAKAAAPPIAVLSGGEGPELASAPPKKKAAPKPARTRQNKLETNVVALEPEPDAAEEDGHGEEGGGSVFDAQPANLAVRRGALLHVFLYPFDN